jgi:hypothetical protein
MLPTGGCGRIDWRATQQMRCQSKHIIASINPLATRMSANIAGCTPAIDA